MDTTQDFIEEYFPNYHSSQTITDLNDLQKLINNTYEEGDLAHELLVNFYMDNIDNPRIQEDYKDTLIRVYEKSIKSYLNSL